MRQTWLRYCCEPQSDLPTPRNLVAFLVSIRCVRCLVILAALQTPAFSSDQRSLIEIDIKRPAAHWLAAGTTGVLPPQSSNGLPGVAPGNIGWFDYDFIVDGTGWYRLLAEASSHIERTDFLFDEAGGQSPTRVRGGRALGGGRFDAGWVWLRQGAHRLRVQNLSWTGIPQIMRIQLEITPSGEPFAFRLLDSVKTAFAIGTCSPLQVEAGGNATPFVLDATFQSDNRAIKRKIEIPASPAVVRHSIDLPCDQAGDVAVDLRSSRSGGELNARAQTAYTVFDTSPVEPAYERGELVVDIDLTNRRPDFAMGETMVVLGPAGLYRTTGENGSTPFIRHKARSLLQRMATLESNNSPSWFAYRVEGLSPGQPHIMEVEYPDDGPRVFVVALRDSQGRGYPTSIGAETGVVWPISGTMPKMSAITWPASSDGRVIVFNIHNGMKAAVGRIRIYKAVLRSTVRPDRSTPGRDAIFWYEEGDNFRALVGESHEPDAVFKPVDRYLSLARSAGATVVSPTVAIYNFAMYPSRFHVTFDDGGRDMTAAFMLSAERYGLKIVPQLHPRADELLWPPRDKVSLERRLLLSAKGEYRLLRPDGEFHRPPFYNPFNPEVRRWYLEMIGELADRYKDYPAFAGIDLRVSNWQNPALNNLESLEWGYEAETVASFFRETGVAPPSGLDIANDTPAAAKGRYRYLVDKQRAAWVRWRCEKMRDIYRDIVLRVRAARPDLRLSVSLFGERTWNAETMREFGIDIDLLKEIDGLTLGDVRLGHGAREPKLDWRRTQHSDLISPETIDAAPGAKSRPNIIFPMEYIEITGEVVPAKAIDLPPPPKEPWVSTAVEPPGRLSLARFAAAVGLTDPYMIGDGGNGYVFGHDLKALRSFIDEFRALPRRPFERVAGIPDAIIVRQSENMFYVVNMLGVSVSARLRLEGNGPVTRLVSREGYSSIDGAILLEFQPFEMATFAVGESTRVVSAQVALGKNAASDLAARAAAEKQSLSRACGVFKGVACAKGATRSQEIDAAIVRGDYWSAEKLLQSRN